MKSAGRSARRAKGETFDKVLGLELGADDYVIKPFDSKELVARVKAVLRRYHAAPAPQVPVAAGAKIVEYPNLIVNQTNYSVIYNGKDLVMPPKELELLYFIASQPNQVFTREQLLDHIWGYEYIGDTRTVDVHIKRLREKITPGPWTSTSSACARRSRITKRGRSARSGESDTSSRSNEADVQ